MELQALLSISVLAVVLVSVTSRAQDPLATGRFRTLLEDDWAYWMAQYPETAPALGYPGHDARRTDYSPAAVAARASHLRDTLTRLDSIDRHGLSADDTRTSISTGT